MLSFPNMYNTSYQKCNAFPLCPYLFSMAMEKTLMTHIWVIRTVKS